MSLHRVVTATMLWSPPWLQIEVHSLLHAARSFIHSRVGLHRLNEPQQLCKYKTLSGQKFRCSQFYTTCNSNFNLHTHNPSHLKFTDSIFTWWIMPVQCRCNTKPQFTRQRLNFSWVDSILHADCSVAQELEVIIQLNRDPLDFQHSVEECQCSQIHTTQRLGSLWLQFPNPHSQTQRFKLTVSIITCEIMAVQCRCDTKPLFRFQRFEFQDFPPWTESRTGLHISHHLSCNWLRFRTM